MKKYYAGIGSREINYKTSLLFQRCASLLEKEGFILRSGGASGSDSAFEIGVKSPENMNIFLPFKSFNTRSCNSRGYIYVENFTPDYDAAYESLKYHPVGTSLSSGPKAMMIRNYFQAMGRINEPPSSFVLCYTKDGANGTSIKTSRESGGTAQCIRIAAANNIPVYNVNDPKYRDMQVDELIDLILSNLKSQVNPDSKIESHQNVYNLF